MAAAVKLAFERELIVARLDEILPLRQVTDQVKATVKYRRIAQSIAEVGVIEPLAVARSSEGLMLLDGHIRYAALIDLGETETRCLLARDDEAFTYNKRVNRLATIQEHYMIVRALDRGVSEEKIAKALNVDARSIRRRRSLLDGVCPEVAELLKDRLVNPVTFDVLRKMKPVRQIEVAELLLAANNFTSSYAKALLAATRQADLARPDKPKKVSGMTPEQMARMEREMASLNQDFKALEASYGDDVLHLVIASGYLARLVGNPEIERFLQSRHPEILDEFRSIITAASLDQTSVAPSGV
ncbi:plasmid partitioning protein RepB C-terminal domain-containing protein [Caulobacter segnis]|uniref:Chromosome partitioning protein ParB n=1 Tax=Caulobacter segnis TaxID=88688 RepID=A0A2W5V737_9CAUL|nr:plasmid partitioning protein RepB C-terminal domain-containing protein [Caulobacter segnis]PZR31085.1 MAG: chromosome partitioning protein ParB [Caulobacter segnis]